MLTSVVQIFNLALDAAGTRDDVASEDEESREAEVCRLWFGPVRDQVLRAAPWPSTKAYSRLALLAERDDTVAWANGDPEPGFRYAYAAPADMLSPRYLSTFGRFTLGVHSNAKAVMTQEEEAILIYTKQQTLVQLWDVQLQFAIVHALAAFIAMPLHAKPQRAARAEQTANELITQARVAAANAEENTYDTVPDWIAARGYGGSAPSTRYLWPNGPMISVSEQAGVR